MRALEIHCTNIGLVVKVSMGRDSPRFADRGLFSISTPEDPDYHASIPSLD
jgi:hypothetical protein